MTIKRISNHGGGNEPLFVAPPSHTIVLPDSDDEDPFEDPLERFDPDADTEDPGNAYEPDEESLAPDIPSIETPAVDVSDAFADTNADPELTRTFAIAVVLTNVGLLAISLGLMFAVFEGRTQLGGVLVLVGGFALARTYQRYRAFRADRNDDRPEESNA